MPTSPATKASVASGRGSEPATPARSGGPSSARSLTADVRARTDDQLRELLRRRPDLAVPPPSDVTSLVARAATRASTQRAMEGLDAGRLQALEALAASGDPVDLHEASDLLGWSAAELQPVVDDLWDRAVLWHTADGYHVVRAAAEMLGPWPAGLGPSIGELRGSVPSTFSDPAGLDALLAQAPPGARAILDQLAWGPPVGHIAPGGALQAACAWLLSHQLVAVHGVDQVVLPREVAIRLRGGRLHAEPALHAPPLPVRAVGPEAADAVAGGQAGQTLELVDELCTVWGERPPRVLRAGGLAVRDLKALQAALEVPAEHAAFLVELAFAAGLVADDGALEPSWLPTPTYDDWSLSAPPARWGRLATAWLASGRAAHLVGTAADNGTVNALSRDALWPAVRQLRSDVLDQLAALAPGDATDAAALVQRTRWLRPLRREESLATAVEATVRESEWLGVTGRGALSTAGRRLLAEPRDLAGLERSAADALPPPVDHVLLQADLTAVAPGRVEGRLARLLRLLADVESRGGATVYRFSPASIRRAFDAGWTSGQVLDALRDVSQTPVPQPLEYLVGDVARRHGTTRVGTVSAYVRSDDSATLDAMLSDRRMGSLQLRRIAPTVLVSPVDVSFVVNMLRDNGFAPVAESLDGGVIVPPAKGRRTPPRREPVQPRLQRVDEERIATLVEALRVGERSRERAESRLEATPGPKLLSTDPSITMSLLREAAADQQRVWIGHTDSAGQTGRVLFLPRRLEGGRAFGTVEGSEVERSFSIHRITGVAPA